MTLAVVDSTMLDAVDPTTRYPTREERDVAVLVRHRRRRAWERRWSAAVREFWRGQAGRLVADLDRFKGTELATRSDVPSDFVAGSFSFLDDDQMLAASVQEIQVGLAVEFGQEALDELTDPGSGVLFAVEGRPLSDWLANDLAERSRLINASTARQMQKIINDGVELGEGINKIQDRIRDRYSGMSRWRAHAIARTEVGRAASAAELDAFHQMDVDQKEWLSAGDFNVRETHLYMDAQVVGIDEDFVSPSGAMGPAPGMLGDPSEDINCRCVMKAIKGPTAPRPPSIEALEPDYYREDKREILPYGGEEEGEIYPTDRALEVFPELRNTDVVNDLATMGNHTRQTGKEMGVCLDGSGRRTGALSKGTTEQVYIDMGTAKGGRVNTTMHTHPGSDTTFSSSDIAGLLGDFREGRMVVLANRNVYVLEITEEGILAAEEKSAMTKGIYNRIVNDSQVAGVIYEESLERAVSAFGQDGEGWFKYSKLSYEECGLGFAD